ncbi:MAG: hypothetical protein ABIQ87_00505, partial [Rubrivivax sp.]
MRWSTFRSSFRAAALTATLALAGTGVAQAIVYTGNWDPPFGTALPFLNFSGSASFYIPDACVARTPNSSSGYVGNYSSCTIPTNTTQFDPMRLVSASVTLTDLRTNLSETLDFLAGIPQQNLAFLVNGIYLQFDSENGLDGLLIGASTGNVGPRQGSIAASKTGDTVVNDFWLRFGPALTSAQGLPAETDADPTPDDYRKAYLLAAASGSGIGNGTLSNPGTVTFSADATAIAEPGSLV